MLSKENDLYLGHIRMHQGLPRMMRPSDDLKDLPVEEFKIEEIAPKPASLSKELL